MDALGHYLAAVGRRDVYGQRCRIAAAFRGQMDFDFPFGLFFVGSALMHQHAGGLCGNDEFGFAVKAAVEIHVGRGGQHVVARGVAHNHKQGVVGAEAEFVRDFERESCGPAAVAAGMASVDEEVGDALGTIETDEDAFVRPFGGHIHVVAVVARGFEQHALACRVGVPGVGQGNIAGIVAAGLRFEEESPALVQRKDLARPGRHPEGKQQAKDKISFHSGIV